ncbi:MAG TPA: PLP-dependent aminotransferase family protein [Streptosporangiaceae bacterium]|jgi:GntR family transcriptional regulator/MocR family aminotransferase|nr:PLP-dependent aminotransferase family protein [Streptosporangiaceae bacterium]
MKKEWAISGLDLHLDLGRGRAPGAAPPQAVTADGAAEPTRTTGPAGAAGANGITEAEGPVRAEEPATAKGGIRVQLEAALRDAVRTGRLGTGTRLPSSRALAADLGVARNTVAEAYAQLVAEGWLTARQGSGTRVANRVAVPPAPSSATQTSPPADTSDPASPARHAGSDSLPWPPARPPGLRPPRYTLKAGSPDLSAFPRAAWLAAARRAFTAVPSHALGYGHPQGRPELREALAEYLARARGVRAHPDRIVVCDGFAAGLALLAGVLRARGTTTLAVEEYGLPTARATASAAGLRLAPLPVDADGAVVGQAGRAGAVLVTPAHQFPLGAALSPGRRTQLVEWARDTGGLVVEDDYDGEFRYDRQPVGAVQALAPEHVVYAGSASKSLAPGFRLGWLVLPAPLAREVAAAQELAAGPGCRLDQLTLAEFIVSGGYDRHVRRSRLAYRRRRDRLAAALAREAPQVRVTGIAAGLHALCELPPSLAEDDVVARALARGLDVDGLAHYRAREAASHGPARQALVVGYGSPPEHAFSGAVARLCAALNDPA